MKASQVRDELRQVLKRLRKFQAWVIRDAKEIEELQEHINSLISLSTSRDPRVEKLLKTVRHDNKTVTRVERRLNIFCERLLEALAHYREVEELQGNKVTVQYLVEKERQVKVYQRLLVKALSKNGTLAQALASEAIQWSAVKTIVDDAVEKFANLLVILNDIERSADGRLLRIRREMDSNSYKAEFTIATMLCRFLNSVFYGKAYVEVSGLMHDIQRAKNDRSIGGAYLAHRIGQQDDGHGVVNRKYFVPNHVIYNYCSELLLRTFNYEHCTTYVQSSLVSSLFKTEEDFEKSTLKRSLFLRVAQITDIQLFFLHSSFSENDFFRLYGSHSPRGLALVDVLDKQFGRRFDHYHEAAMRETSVAVKKYWAGKRE